MFVVPKYDNGNGTIKKSLLNDNAADMNIEHFKSQACKSFCNNCTINSSFSFTDISFFFLKQNKQYEKFTDIRVGKFGVSFICK